MVYRYRANVTVDEKMIAKAVLELKYNNESNYVKYEFPCNRGDKEDNEEIIYGDIENPLTGRVRMERSYTGDFEGNDSFVYEFTAVSTMAIDEIIIEIPGYFPIISENGGTYTLTSLDLKGWENNGITIYTENTQPSSGDLYYKSNGFPYDDYELIVNNKKYHNYISSWHPANNTVDIEGESV